jgi:hypothetical protein
MKVKNDKDKFALLRFIITILIVTALVIFAKFFW